MSCFKKIVFSIPLLAFLVLVSCNQTREVDDIMEKQKIFPTEEGEIVEILYTDSGLVRIRITAPVMNHYTINVPEPYTEMPKGIYVEFYNDSSKIKTTLKADYGIRYEKNKRTEVKNNVVVVNIAGEVLNTDKLNWDEATRKIYTDAFVKITTKKEVLKGTGMEANEDFSEWELKNPVGTVNAPEEEKK
jgi:LPS export ABC transporter protein LptC